MVDVPAAADCCNAVQVFALPRLMAQSLTVALPLYEVPLKVVPLLERLFRLLPRFTPEIAAVPQVVPPMALIAVTKLFAEQADAPP